VAGGGVPRWICGSLVYRAARIGHPNFQGIQASIAISIDGDDWFLIKVCAFALRSSSLQTARIDPLELIEPTINFSRNLPQRSIFGTNIASMIPPENAGAHG
jgi:hypothetical protein